MRNPRSILLIILFTMFFTAASAQTSPTGSATEKTEEQLELEKKATVILEQVVNETSFLKLPENRALVFASAADLIWPRDEKRARQLFRQSAQEIIQANNAPPPANSSPFAMLSVFMNPSPREQILLTISKYDPELALELLYATRPQNVAAALAEKNLPQIEVGQPEKKTPDSMINDSQNKFLADEELKLEQSFSAQVAEKDPTKAAKLLRDSLAKNGVTDSVFDILEKINTKDHELAQKLTGEVGGKLLDSDFARQETEKDLVIKFLRRYYTDKPTETNAAPLKNTPKPLRIEEKLAKNLANKLADFYLQPDKSKNFQAMFAIGQALPVLEKIIPERTPLLKQKQSQIKKSLPEEFTMFGDEMYDGNIEDAPDKISKTISMAEKMPSQMRGGFYRSAVDQAVTEEDLAEARESLKKAPEGKERDEALAYLDSKIAESKIKKGEIEEARKIIDQLPLTKEKIARLVQLAVSFYEKNTEDDRKFADQLMDDARNLTEVPPQDEDGISNYLRVAAGFAKIRPDTAFSMLSLFADQANDIVNASALLAKYDKRDRSFRNGELILTGGLPRIGKKVFDYGKELNLLARTDIDRLRNITDRFQRDDVRILLKLYIVQAFFNEKIGLEGSNSPGPFGDFENLIISE